MTNDEARMTNSSRATATLCDLCGSGLGRNPLRRSFAGLERGFCCAGCLNVYAILFESGATATGRDLRETDLFRQSLRLGLISRPEWTDEKPLLSQSTPDSECREKVFHVSGMWCASCAWVIERVLRAEPGIRSAEVFFASDLVRVRYQPQFVPPGRIEERVAELGYRCSEYTGQRDAEEKERRDLLLRIGVAGFIWMNIMYLSMVFYVGYFEQIAASARRFVPFILMGLSAPAVFYSAYPILRMAWLGLRERWIRMETLLALGILAAWFYSSVQAFRGGPHFYFDTACAIVTLVLTGKLIERSARAGTSRAISLLYRMMPSKVRVIEGERERFVSVETLEPGVEFTVKPGETFPADGIVVEGSSHADESVLTGESAPVLKEKGSSVSCGSTNAGGVLRIRTTRAGTGTTLAQIIRMVEKAMSSRSTLERQADRISRIFVPGVIFIAVVSFGAALFFEHPGSALMRAITVLVVACPCALGIATPLAVTAAVGAASRRGILVSDTRFLETVGRLDHVVLDKTGTVTHGEFRLLDFVLAETAARAEDCFTQQHLPLLAALERYSEHPLGRAVVARASESRIDLCEGKEVTVEAGQGIRGRVAGRQIFIGSRNLPEVSATIIPACMETRTRDWARAGRTVTWYGWDGVVRGALAFGDSIKPNARSVAARLKRWDMRVWVVSGDTRAATAFVASAIGADEHRAGCLPGDKEKIIRDLQSQGAVVAMVGDGVNDAPALAQADLGIAMGSGADVAMRAAPVTLIGADLGRIPEIFSLARATVRIVRQNLFFAFFYNAAGISLAVAGILNPIAAAIAMVLSSISVILNSLRIRHA